MARSPPNWLLAVVVVVGIVVPGVLSYWLDSAGFRLVSDVVWVGGYALMIATVWYGWLSRIELTGPSG